MLVLFVSSALLIAFFQGTDRWKGAVLQSAGDSVSRAYLHVLIAADPTDTGLRLKLAENLLEVREWEDAYEAIAPVLTLDRRTNWDAWLMRLKAERMEAYALDMNDSRRAFLIASLKREVVQLAADDDAGPHLEELATLALEVGRPAVAAGIYEALAVRDKSDNGIHWLAEAAKWRLAAGEPMLAAAAYHKAAAEARRPEEAEHWALEELKTLRAADRGEEALEAAAIYLERFPQNPELLDEGIGIARGQSASKEAYDWGERRLALTPGDRSALESQFVIALEGGRLMEAVVLGEELVKSNPSQPLYRERVAEAAEWAGEPAKALPHWLWLAKRDPSSRGFVRALALARGLANENVRIELLELLSTRRALKSAEFDELFYAYSRVSGENKKTKFLADYLDRYSDQTVAWRALAEILEQQGDLRKASDAWIRVAADPAQQILATLRAANLLWQLKARQKAFELLIDLRPAPDAEHVDYWRVFADQAWELRHSQEAIKAYRLLWSGGTIDILGAERLIVLTDQSGDVDETMSLSEAAFLRFLEPRLLLLGTDAGIRAEKTAGVERLLRVAKKRVALFNSLQTYWLQVGMISTRGGKAEEAKYAFKKILELDPGSDIARESLLWLAIDADDHQELKILLAQWEEDARETPGLWQPYAVGFTKLGLNDRALPWFRRRLESVPRESSLLPAYADTLSKAGDERGALQLRKFAYRRFKQKSIAK